MQVYLLAGGSITPLTVLGGLESLLAAKRALSVVRPEHQEQYVEVGLGNELPQEVALTVRAGATAGADAAQVVDEITSAAAAAERIYLEHDGDAVLLNVEAFRGAGSASPRGAYSYALELRWLVSGVRRAGQLTSDDVAYDLTSDDMQHALLWEEGI